MERYGLVLAGGGSKGAYQIGAWKALREMKVDFDAIVGVSIGSINGALIAADDYDKAVDMWNNISLDKGLKISDALPDPDNLFSKKNWSVLFKEFISKGGFDASPTGEFISRYIDEEKVRKSYIDFGIIAVQLNQTTPKYEMFLEDIPKGELVNYLLASSNIPFATNIGPEGEKYLDGGAYDNLPVMTLKKRGYNKLIVIDISNIKGVAHQLDFINSQTVYIRPYDIEDLGRTFDFDKSSLEKRMQLGYYDTKKAFSELAGRIYYFMPATFRSMVRKYGADTVLHLEEIAHALGVEKLEIYNDDSFILATKSAYMEFLAEEAKKTEAEHESAMDTAKRKIRVREKQENKDNEESIIFSAWKKRFPSKKPLADYKDAIAVLDNYIL